jgi:hypothetical protein
MPRSDCKRGQSRTLPQVEEKVAVTDGTVTWRNVNGAFQEHQLLMKHQRVDPRSASREAVCAKEPTRCAWLEVVLCERSTRAEMSAACERYLAFSHSQL